MTHNRNNRPGINNKINIVVIAVQVSAQFGCPEGGPVPPEAYLSPRLCKQLDHSDTILYKYPFVPEGKASSIN